VRRGKRGRPRRAGLGNIRRWIGGGHEIFGWPESGDPPAEREPNGKGPCNLSPGFG
jgi:hypothetical protein